MLPGRKRRSRIAPSPRTAPDEPNPARRRFTVEVEGGRAVGSELHRRPVRLQHVQRADEARAGAGETDAARVDEALELGRGAR